MTRTPTITPKVGTVILATCTFTDTGGVEDDPGVVECEIEPPVTAGYTETYNPGNIQRTGLGVYELNIDVTEAGLWSVRWIGSTTGPNVVDCRTFVAESCD